MVRVFIWALFIIPWISLFFLNRTAIRRYMPVALFATVLNTIIGQLAWKYDWWDFKETLFSWDKIAPLYTVYSIFLVGTIWIFYFTFRKFWIYFVVNIIVDLLYGLVFANFLGKLDIREKGNLSPLQNLLLMTFIGIILYLYQLWQEDNTRGEKVQ